MLFLGNIILVDESTAVIKLLREALETKILEKIERKLNIWSADSVIASNGVKFNNYDRWRRIVIKHIYMIDCK